MDSVRSRKKEVACVLCDNVDDLYEHAGKQYCIQCLTCPHGKFNAPQNAEVCAYCFRDFYSLWTFTGPTILDPKAYFCDAAILDIDAQTWSFQQEEDFQKMGWWAAVDAAKASGLELQARESLNRLYPYFHLFPRR